jgi:uncharacterized protein
VTTAYVDSSVVLRLVLGEADPLRGFGELSPVSSVLLRVECLRAIERYRLMNAFGDTTVAERRQAVLDSLGAFRLVELTPAVLERAADPFPVSVATLDALHLATAMELRQEIGDMLFATHDVRLASAARSTGFSVVGR